MKVTPLGRPEHGMSNVNKPCKVVRALTFLTIICLIPANKLGNGLFKFNYAKHFFSVLVMAGGSIALHAVDGYLNPANRTIQDYASVKITEFVTVVLNSMFFLVPSASTGVVGYFVSHIVIPVQDIRYSVPWKALLAYFLFSLIPGRVVNPVFEMGSDPGPFIKTWSDSDPVFEIWSDPV